MSRKFLFLASICIPVFAAAPMASAITTASPINQAKLDKDFERFVVEKRKLEKRLEEKHGVAAPSIVWNFFDAAEKGDWHSTSNQFFKIEAGTGRKGGRTWMPLALWTPVHEVFGAYEQFRMCDPELLHRFGAKIIKEIPDGSIYFGGTDAGRFVVSALSASHSEGRPIFTVTQNALADGTYLDYLRDIYGSKINVPTVEDSRKAFDDYLADAGKRFERKQLKEGEEFQIKDGRVQVKGVVAVMAINELLTRRFIEKNPAREIYLEESYAMEGLYQQSLPHGLIFRVTRHPLEQVPRAVIEADHEFWAGECRALIGNVVEEKTSVAELCAWTKKVFLQPESDVFEGNPAYLEETQTPQNFSQCRSAIAAYYFWWSGKTEKSLASSLNKEADFAFRQSVALAPYNPAVIWRYANYLLENKRTNDTKVLIETTLKINPEKRMDLDSDQLQDGMKKLRAKMKEFSKKP